MRTWFRAEASDADVVDLYIFDAIGKAFWDDEAVTAQGFIDALAALPASVRTIRVHINSPGGDPFEAVTIANALREQRTAKGRTIEVRIEGLSASAATIVQMAGDSIRIADNALVMIHNPWSIEAGTADDMRRMAEALDKVRDAIVATYRWRSSKSTDELVAMMQATTWMDADEAITNGFATERGEPATIAARFHPRATARIAQLPVPQAYRQRFAAFVGAPPKAAAALDVIAACEDGGCPELARALIAEHATAEQVQARVTAARAEKDQAATRVTEIRGVCQLAHMDDLAEYFVTGGMSVAGVRGVVTTIRGLIDSAIGIDTSLHPDDPTVSDPSQKAIARSWNESHKRIQSRVPGMMPAAAPNAEAQR